MEEFLVKNADKIMETDGHKKLEQLLQKDKEEFEKQQAEETLKKEAKRQENMKYKIPNRDNLRFKAMAQYKAMKDGDVLGFELIEKRITNKPEIKGMALSSESIEVLEKFKQNLMYESDDGVRVDQESNDNRDTNDRDYDEPQRIKKRHNSQLNFNEERAQDSDKNSNIRSSQNFWEDIEPKLNMNAKMLDFSTKFDDPSLNLLDNLGSPGMRSPSGQGDHVA